jgi:hypothetical protein
MCALLSLTATSHCLQEKKKKTNKAAAGEKEAHCKHTLQIHVATHVATEHMLQTQAANTWWTLRYF